ncbi:MAG: hypothetical protein VZR27_05335 [Acutalibacteraceae bacterium]|nr:zinc-ribbon domain-containing protein [Clostridia bacterium]MEE3450109.1 hypothetical protein [Acutalibacteraceae bacterium]
MFCSNCGNQLHDEDTFCAFCGKQVNNAVRTQARKGSTPVLFAALSITGIVFAVSCVLLFVKPGYLRQNNVVMSSDNDKNKTASVVSVEETDTHKYESTVTETKEELFSSSIQSSGLVSSKVMSSEYVSEKLISSQDNSSAPKPPESKPESFLPDSDSETKRKSQPDYSENNAVYDEAMSYSTNERPTFDEFEWCFGQNGLLYEPTGGERIMNDLGFSGGWKCMIIYNPTNISGTFIKELDNVEIGVNSGSVDLTIDWYLMSNDTQSEMVSEENMPDTLYLGLSLNGGVSAASEETQTSIVIQYFWKDSGKEYALGTMELSDGLSAYVALTR